MGKIPGKWLRNILTGKKEKVKGKCDTTHQNSTTTSVVENPATPIAIRPSTPKEKRRWSFRRSSAAPKESNSAEPTASQQSAMLVTLDSEDEQKKHAMAMAAATAAAADAAVAAAQAAAAVICLAVAATTNGRASTIEEAAAIKIQSVFRSYLARKALSALRGLVKLQALVRGHLVRKRATAMLRCMEALLTVQARARAQRIQVAEEGKPVNQRQSPHRKSTQENRYRHSNYDIDGGMEENIKIVEMDRGEPKGSTKGRNSYSHHPQAERAEYRISTHYPPANSGYGKQDSYQVSPAPSALTEMSPRACSNHFEDYSFNTAQSSPQCFSAMSKPDPSRVPFSFSRPDYAESVSYDYPLFPNYMANTESSRAKVRSQSAPKQRPDAFERQPSRSRASVEGRNVPRAVRMQRSSSHVGSTAKNYHYPWSIRLDNSTVSLKDSECGSTSTVLTNTNYYRSLVGIDIRGDRY